MNSKVNKTKKKIKASAKAKKIYKIVKQLENEIYKMTPKQMAKFSKLNKDIILKTKIRSGSEVGFFYRQSEQPGQVDQSPKK